jgi:hypothetical protein
MTSERTVSGRRLARARKKYAASLINGGGVALGALA